MRRYLGLVLLILTFPLMSKAQVRLFPEEIEIVDVIVIERDRRDLIAFDALTGRRALGFVGRGTWVEERFTPHESVKALRVGTAVGIVITNRRALGLAPDLNHFVAIDIQLKEKLESIAARDTQGTLRTNRRILVFSAPRGFWSEQDRLIY